MIIRTRIQVTDRLALISLEALEDVGLSWKAKGLLSYLLSLPDNEKISTKKLTYASQEGRCSTMTAITELVAAGYIRRINVISGGKMSFGDLVVFDDPAKSANMPEGSRLQLNEYSALARKLKQQGTPKSDESQSA